MLHILIFADNELFLELHAVAVRKSVLKCFAEGTQICYLILILKICIEMFVHILYLIRTKLHVPSEKTFYIIVSFNLIYAHAFNIRQYFLNDKETCTWIFYFHCFYLLAYRKQHYLKKIVNQNISSTCQFYVITYNN